MDAFFFLSSSANNIYQHMFFNLVSKNEWVGINTEFWKHFGVFSHNMKFGVSQF